MANTTAAKVRALLPTLLVDDDDVGLSYSGTNLLLNYPAYDVPTILIDGVESTAFTFERPDKITLSAGADGERYIAQVYKGLPDADIDDIITTIDREIAAQFTNYDSPASGYLEDWSSMGTAARYLKLYATANEENIKRAKALEESMQDGIDSYKENTAGSANKIVIKVNA
jgi:hypothetical protein